MYRKLRILFCMCAILMLMAACSGTSPDEAFMNDLVEEDEDQKQVFTVTYTQEFELTFQEAIDLSDCVVVAEYVSYEDKDAYVVSLFQVKNMLRGTAKEEMIHVVEMKGTSTVLGTDYSYKTGGGTYEAGKQYILVLNRNDLLFYEYPHYVPVTDIFIPVDDIESAMMYGEPIDELQDMNVSTLRTNDLFMRARPVEEEEPSYTTAEDIPTIIEESDYLLEVQITGMMGEGIVHDGVTYFCKVLDVLQGGTLVTAANDTIYIVFMKDSVQLNETYIVMVNQAGEQSLLFTQSSLNSIIDPDDGEAMAMIAACIA